jgi:hypothetical protein
METLHADFAPRKSNAMPEFCFNSLHAVDSLIERTRMTSDDLLEILSSGRGVWMNNPERHWQHRSYILFYSTIDAAFFVAIVACDPGTNNASIVTVLTQTHYENDRGAFYNGILLRAMKASTASKETVDAFRAEHELVTRRKLRSAKKWAEKAAQRAIQIEILVDYTTETGVFERTRLENPPGYDMPEVAENEALVASQPGFWTWFADQARLKHVPIERVLALKAAQPGRLPVNLLAAT